MSGFGKTIDPPIKVSFQYFLIELAKALKRIELSKINGVESERIMESLEPNEAGICFGFSLLGAITGLSSEPEDIETLKARLYRTLLSTDTPVLARKINAAEAKLQRLLEEKKITNYQEESKEGSLSEDQLNPEEKSLIELKIWVTNLVFFQGVSASRHSIMPEHQKAASGVLHGSVNFFL